MRRALLILAVLLSLQGYSQIQHQDLVAYKAKYPERNKVLINDEGIVTIDFNKGDSLDITSIFKEKNIYLSKVAANYAEKSVRSSYFRRLQYVKASTLVPVNETKYKTYKVKEFKEKKTLSGSIFFDDSKVTTFTYPNMREGAITDLEYSVKTITPQLIGAFYFGSVTNVENSVFSISHHKDIKVDFKMFNGADTLCKYTQTEKGNYLTHKWEIKDLAPLEFEGGSPSYEATAPHIYPIIREYTIKGQTVKVLGEVDDLHNWYTDLLNRSQIEDYEPLKLFVDSLTKGTTNELEKVEKVYDWVQKDVKYVAYEDGLGGFIPRPPQLVYKRKFGDCKDMALLQVKMLEYAGVEAHVGWVGTRTKPYSYKELPTPGCDNHMIAVYKNGNDWIFLDATGTYTPFGYPSGFIQGKEVMVHIDDTSYEIVTVPTVRDEQNAMLDSVFLTIDDEVIKGQGKIQYTGYPLSDIKYRIVDSDSIRRSKILRNYLEKGSNKFFFDLKDYNLDDSRTGYVTYSFDIKDYLKKNDDEIYLNLNLEKVLSENKVDKDRKTSIESDNTLRIKNVYTLDLGNQYKVTYLPESQKGGTERFNYAITYQQKGDKIIYSLELNLNYLVLETNEFDEWNKMIKSLNKKYKEVIVLKSK